MPELKVRLKDKAHDVGFDVFGVSLSCKLPPEHCHEMGEWVAGGRHAGMGYMEKNVEKRLNPSLLLDGARSVICVGMNYKPDRPSARPGAGRIANYALYPDYHVYIKDKLKELGAFIQEAAGVRVRMKACVDSAPLAERSLAYRAGLGFIGKNRMLIHPRLGPEIFLAEVICDIDLEPDMPAEHSCGDCRECIRACPTGALSEEGLDARKCLSYLTIEHKGEIPERYHAAMGTCLFGCDRCVAACPYQQNAPAAFHEDFAVNPVMLNLRPGDILEMDAVTFEKVFGQSPAYRTGLERLKRNARICLANMK